MTNPAEDPQPWRPDPMPVPQPNGPRVAGAAYAALLITLSATATPAGALVAGLITHWS